MSDLYELQLALDFPDSLPEADLGLLRWHLGQGGDAASTETGETDEVDGVGEGEETDEAAAMEAYPLLSSKGAAHRVGGALVGELCRGPRGWALTARQEVHPDEFDDLQGLLAWLASRTTTIGAIGCLRFYESDVPEVLIADSGRARRLVLRAAGPARDDVFSLGLD
ncbi:hypothetical protein AB0M39_29540 [Streptomyces sp. NPDC051907]|uniref:hypothetical protein n=1 Tax=Streptomyces sp. NPDC051907 TaxID=3155284 RepID=UPI00343E9637